MGDRSLEFLAAGGTAVSHLDMGEVDQARRWLDRAAAIASEHPTPLRARRLETWRGLARSTAGDAAGMREHLERAVGLALESGLFGRQVRGAGAPGAGGGAARGGDEDDDLLELAERSAGEAAGLAAELPGHAPWTAQAEAALAKWSCTGPDRRGCGSRARGGSVAGVGDARGPVPGRHGAGGERAHGSGAPSGKRCRPTCSCRSR